MRVKSPYDEPRIVPLLGDLVVEPGQIVDIPEDTAAMFIAAGWTPTDVAAKKAADKEQKEQTDGDR